MIDINKNRYLYVIGSLVLIFILSLLFIPKTSKELKTSKIDALVISKCTDTLTVRDTSNLIYTFNVGECSYDVGDNVVIEYTGLLDKNREVQRTELISITPTSLDDDNILSRSNPGIFSNFSTLADKMVKDMSLDEKIGQILLVRYAANKYETIINNFKVGGFVFFRDDFKGKTTKEVQDMINSSQKLSKIPLLTAVDEEGGSVVRVSSNDKLIDSEFASPRDLYLDGGFDLIASDTKKKSAFLSNLGLNVNLAPVVDVSTNSSDYMYNRTLGENATLTSTYASTVIDASKGLGVSYVLKHFPGYGNNGDTHTGVVVDDRDLSYIEENDLLPFRAGIDSGAEAVLVSHNIVKSIDEDNPASLSASVHNLLTNSLDFTGVTITDDLSMGATSSIDNVYVKALLAGNDILIVTDYEKAFNEIKDAVENGQLSEELLDEINHKIISWKYYKGMLYEKIK